MGLNHRFFKDRDRAQQFADYVDGEICDVDDADYYLVITNVVEYGEDYKEQGYIYMVSWED